MSLQIQIAARRDFQSKDLWDMHKLRAKVFKDRMGWDVPIMSGMEIDGYDAIEPHYMMMKEPGGILRGCWRILPTEGPYMLKDSFPELLHGQPAPAHPKIWELSRFAIETEGRQNFGFSELAMESIEKIISYGHHMGIEHYVTVTTTAIAPAALRRRCDAALRPADPNRSRECGGLARGYRKNLQRLMRYAGKGGLMAA